VKKRAPEVSGGAPGTIESLPQNPAENRPGRSPQGKLRKPSSGFDES
jgi:hypothetical protein